MPSIVDTQEEVIRPQRVSWGAIIAGTVLTLGLWMLLMVLGVALGLSSISPGESSISGESMFTGIWALVAPLIALFLGGLATGRLAGLQTRGSGLMHGAVVWALTSLLGFWVIASTLGAAISGVANIGGEAISKAAGGASELSLQQLGLDGNDLLAPVNARLREAGKPEVTGNQLEAAAKDALGTAVREGRFDRQLLLSSLAENTALSPQDAREVAGAIETRWNERRGELQGTLAQVQQKALGAADTTGKALWWVFAMMFLGLVSAVLGGMVGVREHVHRVPLATRREVIP